MGRISAYQSPDGRLFTDRSTYMKHCRWLELRVILRPGIQALFECEDPTERDAALARKLLEQRDKLIALLRWAEEVEP